MQLHVPGIRGDRPSIHVLPVDEHIEQPDPRGQPQAERGACRHDIVAGEPAQPATIVDRRRDQDPRDTILLRIGRRDRSRHWLLGGVHIGRRYGLLAEVVGRTGGAGRHFGLVHHRLRAATAAP